MEMIEANAGDRLEKLKALAELLAEKMDEVKYIKDLPPLAKQYRETIREIDELEGGAGSDDEISEILSSRDGMSDSVRKNRSGL